MANIFDDFDLDIQKTSYGGYGVEPLSVFTCWCDGLATNPNDCSVVIGTCNPGPSMECHTNPPFCTETIFNCW